MRIIASLFAAFAVLFSAPAMAADWYVVETEHFTVYTKDTKRGAEEYGKDLERLDQALRIVSGVGLNAEGMPESSKVLVFRFGETSDMGKLRGQRGVGGFFRGDAAGSVAFVPRRENIRRERGFSGPDYSSAFELAPKGVLFHEYVHHFMFHYRDAPYPLWYSEGFAEVFSTLRFEGDYFILGDVPSWRSVQIMDTDIDLEEMLAPGEEVSREYGSRAYGHGWLLANYLNLTPERRSQIGPYLEALHRGTPPLDAAKQAFGDLDQLEQELEDFRKGRAEVMKVRFVDTTEPEVSIREMTRDEEARIDLMIRSKAGVTEDQAKAQVAPSRELVERFPKSVPVLLAATEVEFDNANWNEAEALAKRALDIDPSNINAAIYYARVALMRGYNDPSQYAVARQRFLDAYKLVSDHPYPLYGYYMSYLYAEEEPPEDALIALEQAFELGPYDSGIRSALAHLLATEGRYNASISLLRRFTIGPGKGPRELLACFALAEAGDSEELLESLKPEHPEYEDENEKEWDDKTDAEKWPCLTKQEAATAS